MLTVWLGFAIYRREEIGKKAAHKMWVKMSRIVHHNSMIVVLGALSFGRWSVKKM